MPGGNRHTPERHHTRQLRRDERGTGGETRELRSSQYAFLLVFTLQISDYMRHTATRTETRESRFKSVPGQPALVLDDARLVLCTLVLTVTRHTTGHRRGEARAGATKRHVETAQPAVFAPHNFASMIAYIVYNQESCNAPRPLYSLRLQYAYASAGSARALDGTTANASTHTTLRRTYSPVGHSRSSPFLCTQPAHIPILIDGLHAGHGRR